MTSALLLLIAIPGALGIAVPMDGDNTAVLSMANIQDSIGTIGAHPDARVEQSLRKIARNMDWLILSMQFISLVLIMLAALVGFLYFKSHRKIMGFIAESEGYRKRSSEYLDTVLRRARETESLGAIYPHKLLNDKERSLAERIAGDPRCETIDRLIAMAFLQQGKNNWQEALGLWKAVAAIQEDDARSLLGIACCSEQLADSEKDAGKKRALLDQACSTCEEASKHDNRLWPVWSCWGGALLKRAGLEQHASGKQHLLRDAAEKCLRAEELKPGQGGYALAAIAALQGDKDACKSWLEKSEASGHLPSAEHIEKDRDFTTVRRMKWFKELIARQRAREQENP